MPKEAPVKEPEKKEEEAPEAELSVDAIRAKIDDNKELTREEMDFFLKEVPGKPVEGYTKGAENLPKPEEEEEEPEKKPEEGEEKKAEEKEELKQQIKDDKISEGKSEEEKEDFAEKLEVALNEPDEKKADLSGFSKKERAYFHRMRREIKARQQAEADRDQALFREDKLKKQLETGVNPNEDIVAEFKKRDPNDLLTNEEVVQLLEKQKQVQQVQQPQEQQPEPDMRWNKYLQMADAEARQTIEDYEVVVELAPEFINKNEKALVEIAEAMKKGENPAIKTYELIKSNPEFEELLPIAEARAKIRKNKAGGQPAPQKELKEEKSPEELEKEAKAQKAEADLEKSKQKPKTTAHIGSGAEKGDEITLDEYLKMDDKAFAKLPKKEREALLEKYGA